MYEIFACGRIGGVENKQSKIPPPPRLIASLSAGFDTAANNILLISLPVLLDVFLWLGPRLSLNKLLQPAIDYFTANSPAVAPEGLDPTLVTQVWVEFLNKFSLFSILRTIPVGVASLMSSKLPQISP